MSYALAESSSNPFSMNAGSPSSFSRSRRRYNQPEIQIGRLTDNSAKKGSRGSSGGGSDYNVDSDTEDGPVITNKSIQFNQPINQKNGKISTISYQDEKEYTPSRNDIAYGKNL